MTNKDRKERVLPGDLIPCGRCGGTGARWRGDDCPDCHGVGERARRDLVLAVVVKGGGLEEPLILPLAGRGWCLASPELAELCHELREKHPGAYVRRVT